MAFSVLKIKDYTGLRIALQRTSRLVFFQMPQIQIRISISSLLSGIESFVFNFFKKYTTALHNEEYADKVIKQITPLYSLLAFCYLVRVLFCKQQEIKAREGVSLDPFAAQPVVPESALNEKCRCSWHCGCWRSL